jgi:hypothetical protein
MASCSAPVSIFSALVRRVIVIAKPSKPAVS